jgi:hypothetical protein
MGNPNADSAINGGAPATMIRAVANADDHISENASPMKIARMSMIYVSRQMKRAAPWATLSSLAAARKGQFNLRR